MTRSGREPTPCRVTSEHAKARSHRQNFLERSLNGRERGSNLYNAQHRAQNGEKYKIAGI